MGSVVRVLTLGTFDCLHYGHVRLFQRCARLGRVTAGVNSDQFVRRYKGRSPVANQEMRCATVAALRNVDEVLVNDGPGRDLIYQVLPHFLVVGSDWHENRYLNQIDVTQEDLDGWDVSVVYVPRTAGVSSRLLRERVS